MDSGYWLREIKQTARKIDEKNSYISEYKAYKDKLSLLSEKLSAIADYIQTAGNSLSSGGFVVSGKIPFEDDFIKNKKILDSQIEELNSLISKINTKIIDMKIELKTLQNSNSSAKDKYNEALKKERG